LKRSKFSTLKEADYLGLVTY